MYSKETIEHYLDIWKSIVEQLEEYNFTLDDYFNDLDYRVELEDQRPDMDEVQKSRLADLDDAFLRLTQEVKIESFNDSPWFKNRFPTHSSPSFQEDLKHWLGYITDKVNTANKSDSKHG